MSIFVNRIEKAEENDNKCWYVLMLIFSIIFYVGSLAAIILLYIFFTEVCIGITCFVIDAISHISSRLRVVL